jgi:hypothetical protein
MYDMMDADFFVSCLFFIATLLSVNYWLFSLFALSSFLFFLFADLS